MKKFQ